MHASNSDSNEVLVDCQSVWKVFGSRSDEAIRAIQLEGLTKSQVLARHKCVVGVSDASFQLRRGEVFCVMGLSGSGKSTLIRLLNRLIEPSLGKVLVKGKDLAKLGSLELREMRARHIGMVFQNVALLPYRNVLENAAFGLEVQGIARKERNETALKTLQMVGLADWADRYPSELSGGMQQRVGLARALAADPEIILMDEPFSALDPLIRRQLQDEFRQLSKRLGKSSVFITHDLDEAIRIGDRIAIMKDGVIIQTGTPEEIVLNPADDYVADFVAGISRLHLVRARSVANSLEDYRREHPEVNVDLLPKTNPDADIDELIGLAMQSKQDAIAVTENGAIVGVVTIRGLLQGVKGTSSDKQTAA
jgi:glycine betaine/proline transport system ATP-binding protein